MKPLTQKQLAALSETLHRASMTPGLSLIDFSILDHAMQIIAWLAQQKPTKKEKADALPVHH